ncbi:site-specific integrase [Variovorax sp. RTB1]|uniref:site-specific integrase n=1 Tax=Variovorax sp. RTB1 TaxID=3048631 RepID=UPI002B222775|nr:site-specific integrase [Variovorax sp. RTB1]MEB0114344.1 site-specific integrase [Variovorax sp. RTB1]
MTDRSWAPRVPNAADATATGALDFDTSEREYAPHSLRLYLSLWRVFCAYIAGKRLRLDQVRSMHIHAFLDQLSGRKPGQPASVRTRRTYLAEIDRVYRHLVLDVRILAANPATPVLEHARRHHVIRNEPAIARPGFLAAYERAAALLYREELARSPGSWEPSRNLAMRLVASQCGLTLKELCKLIPANVTPRADGNVEIHAPGHRLILTRRLLGTARLADALALWKEQRDTLTIERSAAGGRGPVRLFLTAPEGRPRLGGEHTTAGGTTRRVGRTPIAENVAERVIGECVKRTAADTGVPAYFNGPRFVRTAFAAQLLYEGVPDADIGNRLGLRTMFTVAGIKARMGAFTPRPRAAGAQGSTRPPIR